MLRARASPTVGADGTVRLLLPNSADLTACNRGALFESIEAMRVIITPHFLVVLQRGVSWTEIT
jgi:hypothetical protein